MPVHDSGNQVFGICHKKKQGIKPDDDKVKIIRSMPESKTVIRMTSEVTITRSRWLVVFSINLEPYNSLLNEF